MLGMRLADKVMQKKRDAKSKTLGIAKKSAFGDTPGRIKKAMGKTPEMKSPALNVSKPTNPNKALISYVGTFNS